MGTSINAQRPTRARDFVLALLALVLGCALVFGTATTAQAADKVEMPNVVGISAKTAQALLREEGFIVKLKPVAKGPVITPSHWKVSKQSVKAGKKIKVGKKIKLTVKLDKKYSTDAGAMIATPAVVGLAGDDAQNLLTAQGLTVKFDAGEESVWAASNWDVVGQDPAAGQKVKKASTITLKMQRRATPTTAAGPDATSAGLDAGHAGTACDQYGKAQFPYGWKGHLILGQLASENQGDHYFWKFTADVTNAYNAKAAVTVECTVGGSNEAPQVTSFNVY